MKPKPETHPPSSAATTAGHEAAGRVKVLHCPNCGSELAAELLVFEAEAGREAVLALDCPTGDLHLAVTEADVAEALAQEVVARLRLRGAAA